MKHLRFAKNLKIISFLNINRSARIITIIISISILLLILFGTINPNFLHFNNFLNMGHQMAVTAVIAFAMTAVILAKGIDLSVGSTLAVSGVVGGLAIQNGFSAILVILIILLVGTLVGSLNGF